jgi:hypothetical protein
MIATATAVTPDRLPDWIEKHREQMASSRPWSQHAHRVAGIVPPNPRVEMENAIAEAGLRAERTFARWAELDFYLCRPTPTASPEVVRVFGPSPETGEGRTVKIMRGHDQVATLSFGFWPSSSYSTIYAPHDTVVYSRPWEGANRTQWGGGVSYGYCEATLAEYLISLLKPIREEEVTCDSR